MSSVSMDSIAFFVHRFREPVFFYHVVFVTGIRQKITLGVVIAFLMGSTGAYVEEFCETARKEFEFIEEMTYDFPATLANPNNGLGLYRVPEIITGDTILYETTSITFKEFPSSDPVCKTFEGIRVNNGKAFCRLSHFGFKITTAKTESEKLKKTGSFGRLKSIKIPGLTSTKSFGGSMFSPFPGESSSSSDKQKLKKAESFDRSNSIKIPGFTSKIHLGDSMYVPLLDESSSSSENDRKTFIEIILLFQCPFSFRGLLLDVPVLQVPAKFADLNTEELRGWGKLARVGVSSPLKPKQFQALLESKKTTIFLDWLKEVLDYDVVQTTATTTHPDVLVFASRPVVLPEVTIQDIMDLASKFLKLKNTKKEKPDFSNDFLKAVSRRFFDCPGLSSSEKN